MKLSAIAHVVSLLLVFSVTSYAKDLSSTVKNAVQHATLDQPGTRPFHLKALLAPTLARDKDSGRSGEVEIWWATPDQWRREVRCPEFHQVQIVNGSREWQKNEGAYFPEWLREIAVELVRPVPQLDDVLQHVKGSEARGMMGQIEIDWITPTGTAEVHNIRRSGITLDGSTGELLYASGFGWGGGFRNYAEFHGRRVARKVSWGSPEVTATVTVLEELGSVPEGFFDPKAQGTDSQSIHTALLDETTLRKNLLPDEPAPWPTLQDGPLEGNVTTEIVVDREGKVQELKTIISENSAIDEAGRQRIMAMRFKPFLQDNVPVQVLSQITVPFKTTRPLSSETFESARTYFDRGRKVSFLAAGSTVPYALTAEFIARGSQGAQGTGKYEDTWQDSSHWRREASFGNSRYAKTQNGQERYELSEGPDVALLRFVFKTVEPIPALDTFIESDWRIKRDKVNDTDAIRVLAGYESPEGKLDPEEARGYWFDNSGRLIRTFLQGLETNWSQFEEYGGIGIARRIDVMRQGKLAAHIQVTAVTPLNPVPDQFFVLKGHEWQRAFTAEER